MEQLQGVKNFIRNIKPIMDKCNRDENLSKDEKRIIIEFWLEVTDFIYKQ